MAQSEDHIWADSRVRFCGVVAETLTESLRSAGRSGGRRGRRRRGFFRAPFAGGGARNFGDNLFSPRFAYRAIAVVDAALRQGEPASTRAAFRIEFMQSDLLLLRSETGKIHTRKLAGTIGVREEDLSGVFKRFHARIDG